MKRDNEHLIGYTTGVFDLFHIGHLNIIKNAKANCDFLIIGVTSDDLAEKLKNKRPVIPLSERLEIIKSIKFVDKVIVQNSIDEISDFHRLHFNIIFKGSDWRDTSKWTALEIEFAKLNVKVKYFPYTKHTSSTILRNILDKL